MLTAFRLEELTAGYERNIIFKNLNASIEYGKITTIIGPNGCGKSTLLKTMGRILKKEKGHVYLQEQDMQALSTKEIAKRLAVLSQSPQAPPQLTVRELVSYGRYPHRKNVNRLSKQDRDMIDWAMAVTQTAEFEARELAQLSGGQRQRVWLAMALAQKTEILLLDEPTTYLDMAHQIEVLKIVKKLNEEHGCTIVMVLHDINQASRFSDTIIAMRNGEVLATGAPKQIMTPPVLKSVFQINATIIEDAGIPICISYDVLS
ncbi:ABC transporter ATP-binding protein [Robertmurraya siralis]|uniref:ABC transporter ATP-binding protein n=1 Tax=Robertmurraya siralis TaxID=77777 RepID=A0A920BVD6_9BACI|nr:ABC transporter ATP-binding protein [Robertmurraya siralis]GIN63277.1 ABC transporter ATP-binding protein [Robertmurraya siralis]